MKKHRSLGRITSHHLVPRVRIRDYYGAAFALPRNRIKLWELKHAAWHVLFRLKTINEIITYLGKRDRPYGYYGPAWKVVFGSKTSKQARSLLVRTRRIIRKKYEHFELDPMLRQKVKIYHKKLGQHIVNIHLNNRFKKIA
jgi:hypothetical protein